MRSIAGLVLVPLLIGSASATANEITIELEASVATLCSVNNIAALDIQQGRIAVDVTCNSDSFALEMGGDLSGIDLHHASVENAAMTRSGSGVAVQSFRPGSFQFVLDYDRDLSHLSTVTASLRTA